LKTLPSRFLLCDVPGRPWWKQEAQYLGESCWKRIDGKEARSVADIPVIDQEDPLPRPPFEMGQVWLLVIGEGSRTYTLLGRLEVQGPNHSTIRYWNIIGPYVPAQISEDQLNEYLVDGYLLHDPIGKKAPWAPWTLA
jgi:hypothetical protein